MTYPEVKSILEAHSIEINDQRRWELALRAKNPVEAYNEMKSQEEILETTVDIDMLPEAQKAWLRAT